ncbi:hypothetical protein BGX20_005405, partial [Mortierella sp. AD010]
EQERINKGGEKKYKEQQTTRLTEPEKQPPPRLQDYCPCGIYISMVIIYPAEVVKSQVVRPDPDPECKDLTRIIINIDDTNFARIFPEKHVNFLDMLKKSKRSKRKSEDQDEHSGFKKPRISRTRSAPQDERSFQLKY